MADMLHENWIKSSPEKVFKALTTEKGLKGWWTTETDYDSEKHTITFGFFNKKYWFKFKVLNNEANKNSVWECIDSDIESSDWIKTRINFELIAENGSTRLKFNHIGWPENSPIFARCNSTWGHLMFSLKDFLEKGKGFPLC